MRSLILILIAANLGFFAWQKVLRDDLAKAPDARDSLPQVTIVTDQPSPVGARQVKPPQVTSSSKPVNPTPAARVNPIKNAQPIELVPSQSKNTDSQPEQIKLVPSLANEQEQPSAAPTALSPRQPEPSEPNRVPVRIAPAPVPSQPIVTPAPTVRVSPAPVPTLPVAVTMPSPAVDSAPAPAPTSSVASPTSEPAPIPPEPKPVTSAARLNPRPIQPNPVCLHWGPWPSRSSALEVATKLQEAGIESEELRTEDKQLRGRWVFYPAENRTVAETIGAELRQQGVKDWAIFPGPQSPLVVSVGVFSTQEGLDARLALLAKMSRQPVISDQFNTQANYAVTARIVPGRDLLPAGLPATLQKPCTDN